MSEELKENRFSEEQTKSSQDATEPSDNHEEKNREHHSHHHHHGHRRHHSSRHSNSRKQRKLKRFFRKNKYKIGNIVACIVIVALLVTVAFQQDWKSTGSEDTSSLDALTQSTIKIESSVYTEPVSLVHDAVSAYMDPENILSAHDVYGKFQGYNTRVDIGVPVTYSYEITGMPSNIAVKNGVLEVSEYLDYSNAQQVEVAGHSQKVKVPYLKVNTKYYYRLTLTLSNDAKVGTNGEFVTQKNPRILSVDGIRNVRDFGGWKTVNGKEIKQGLLYRGTELDGAVESTYRLTAQGLTTMTQILGIRFDMDLRSPSVNINRVDALGSNMPHKYYDLPMYSDIFATENNEIVRKIFEDLANKDNYPIYLHCTHGRDRTGTICYLLDGLLGVSKEDAYKEYELSAFVDSYVATEEFKEFQQKVDSFAGTTFQQKVETYLLSVGVTPAEINSIREIYLGE